MKLERMLQRRLALTWIAGLLGLTILGCTARRWDPPYPLEERTPQPITVVTILDTIHEPEPEPPPPPLVPAGLDTSFVEELDLEFGLIPPPEEEAEIAAEIEVLVQKKAVIDTVGSVVRFLAAAAGPDDDFSMLPEDSLVVGRILLRAFASGTPSASLVDQLDAAISNLQAVTATVDTLAGSLTAVLKGPRTRQDHDRLRVALLGFTREGTALRDRIKAIQSELTDGAQRIDSTNVYRKLRAQVQEFERELSNTINQTGRVAVQLRSETQWSAAGLRRLSGLFRRQQEDLLRFEAMWDQFEAAGSLEITNPDKPYDGSRMRGLIGRIDEQYLELARQAQIIAAQRDSADQTGDVVLQFESGEAAYEFGESMLLALQRLPSDLEAAVQEFARYGNRYWDRRRRQDDAAVQQRTALLSGLEGYLERHGGVQPIRESADLSAAYAQLSDTVLRNWRDHLDRVVDHDARRVHARQQIANVLYDRARTLGSAEDYAAAREAFRDLLQETPGSFDYEHLMANLCLLESREDDRSDRERDTLLTLALAHLAECETILWERHRVDTSIDSVTAELHALAGRGDSLATPDSLPLWEVPLPAADFYYKKFFPQAREDVLAWGPALGDQTLRDWLPVIERMRAGIAFTRQDRDAYFTHEARALYLSDPADINVEKELTSLQNLSWDDGNLALYYRVHRIYAMPDSTEELSMAKRDSLQSALAAARTTGGQRMLSHQLTRLEFLKLSLHDDALGRLHRIVNEIPYLANPNPEAGAIDSTIVHEYPIFLFNRATYFQEQEQNREAFYCFLGVATEYGQTTELRFRAMFQAANLLRSSNRRGALHLVSDAVSLGYAALAEGGSELDITELIQAHEMQRDLAKLLRRADIANRARDQIHALRAMMEQFKQVGAEGVQIGEEVGS